LQPERRGSVYCDFEGTEKSSITKDNDAIDAVANNGRKCRTGSMHIHTYTQKVLLNFLKAVPHLSDCVENTWRELHEKTYK